MAFSNGETRAKNREDRQGGGWFSTPARWGREAPRSNLNKHDSRRHFPMTGDGGGIFAAKAVIMLLIEPPAVNNIQDAISINDPAANNFGTVALSIKDLHCSGLGMKLV